MSGAPAQKSPEWFQLRKNVITGTDIAAIIGISRFDSIDDILYKKMGVEKRFSQRSRDAMAHGNMYEDEARQVYERIMCEKVHETGLCVHEKYPWLASSPDGVTETGKLIEIKCPVGDFRSEIPNYYMTQVQLGMEVLDVESCDYIEYKPGFPMRIQCVPRDREWFRNTLLVLEAFWTRVNERRLLPLCEIIDDDHTIPAWE
jgi:putative phage-type endonuclease